MVTATGAVGVKVAPGNPMLLQIAACRTIGFEEGVIIRSTLGRMIMAPALIASHSELDELVEKTKRAIDRTAKEVGLL